jgi:hypothetical protein
MSTPIYPWLATPEDVAALLRSRTKDDAGRELGAWTDATRPTLVDVEQLIALAAGQTTDADGPASTSCSSLCRNVIALHAACLVELSYFPEQVRSERSPYSELRELLVDARAAFDTCRAAGSPDDPGAGAGYGYHSLPTTPLTTYNAYGGDAALEGWRHPERPATWQQPQTPPSTAQPARIDDPEPAPEPPIDIHIGHPEL